MDSLMVYSLSRVGNVGSKFLLDIYGKNYIAFTYISSFGIVIN